MSEHDILILGVGNLLLGDEGVGVHVAQQLQRMSLSPKVEVIDGGTAGFELIEHCRGKKKIIIVDAVIAGAEPGAVFRFTPEVMARHERKHFSAHQTGLHELLHFCRALVPPPAVIIYGVVPQETKMMSIQLSTAVKQRLGEIVAKIIEEVGNTSV